MLAKDIADRWTPVESSMLAAVGTKDDYLIVEFKNGDVYRYPDAAEQLSLLLMADSLGKYFHSNIRSLPAKRLSFGEWPED